MQESANKLLPTMINFQQTYELMKSYLSKKRFSYVYQECIKYYNKNHAFFSNHEVLFLVRMVFYVLKKKMISKFVGGGKNNWSVESVYEIFSVMTNVFLSWENVLMVQMNAQETVFFQMIHKSKEFRKNRIEPVRAKMPQSYLFEAKKQFVITKKINVEHKIYLFFKQCLRMVINSLSVMASCMNINKVEKMIKTIKKGDSIITRFSEHQFPIQKIEFYIVKCQILQFLAEYGGKCISKSIKYEFPVGLFQRIYRNIYKWKEAKTFHYIHLLFKMVYVSVKNELISILDAYVLVKQIKLLIFVIKKKDIEVTDRLNSMKGRRGAVELKTSIHAQPTSKQPSCNSQQKDSQKHDSLSQSKWKAKCFNALKMILHEIQTYISSRNQLTHIIRVYMEDMYWMYKQNPMNQNDQLIDEIPALIEREIKKGRKQKIINSLGMGQKQDFTEQVHVSKRNFMVSDMLSSVKKETHHDDEHGHQLMTGHFQSTKKKQNKIILKNILNVKHKKLLSLTKRTSEDWKKTNRSQSTHASDTTNTQPKNQQDTQKFPYTQLISTLVSTTFRQLKVLHPQANQPLHLLLDSQSDSDNQLQYQFEKKRKTTIQQLNNKFYKHSNPNYMEIDQIGDLSSGGKEHNNNNNSWDDEKQDGGQESSDDVILAGRKKISDDLQFDQIRLLDQVIKEKIFAYLDLELVDTIKDTKTHSFNQSPTNSSKSTKKSPMINPYSQILKSTDNLKSSVDELNKKRKLIIEKLKYKNYSLKTYQRYNPIENSQNFHSSVFKDLQNIYNTKNNLTQKAQKCVKLYKTLLKVDQLQNQSQNSVFDRTVKKYGQIYKKYNEELSMIGEQDDEDELTQRRSEELPILEYIVKNRPISLLEETLKRKEIKSKFNCSGKKEIFQGDKKQIALRDSFNNLRTNISKTQFNETNSLTKNFTLKVPNFQ